MSELRNYFKLRAQANEDLFKIVLEESFEDLWQIATTCESRVNACFQSSFKDDEKKYIMIIMLRNSISDLLCTIDSIERGHGQTVLNNLRMVFEHLCLTFDMNTDNTVFESLALRRLKDVKY